SPQSMAGGTTEVLQSPLKRRKGSHVSTAANADCARNETETPISLLKMESLKTQLEAADERESDLRSQLSLLRSSGAFSLEFTQQLRDELRSAKEQIGELKGQLEEATFEAKTAQNRAETSRLNHADENMMDDLRKECSELQKKFGHQTSALNLMRFERNEWKRQAEEESGKNSDLSSLLQALSNSGNSDVESTKRALELEEETKLLRQAMMEWKEETLKERKMRKGLSEELASMKLELKKVGDERKRFEKERDDLMAKVASLQKDLVDEKEETDRLRHTFVPPPRLSSVSLPDVTTAPPPGLTTAHSDSSLTDSPPPSLLPLNTVQSLPTLTAVPRSILVKAAMHRPLLAKNTVQPIPASTIALPPLIAKATVLSTPAPTAVLPQPPSVPTVIPPLLANTTLLPAPLTKTTALPPLPTVSSSRRASASRPSSSTGSRTHTAKKQNGSSSMNWRNSK
ncbi:hypothetical protein PFISCL1PPCAC_6699, partial [Pristionchus fissidentatus]